MIRFVFLNTTVVFISLIGLPSTWARGEDLLFKRACDSGTTLTISAVGDLLLHSPLQRQAYEHPEGFKSLWEQATPFFKSADIAYANLEGSVAKDLDCGGNTRTQSPAQVETDCRKNEGSVYTSYPRFNYHPRLIDDLLSSGIDVVSTANNHSLDRGPEGANLTIDQLEASGLAFTGTRRQDESKDSMWTTVTTTKGLRIGWISCTYGTNGVPDPHDQVLHCFDDERVTHLVKSLKAQTDAVIVTPHWGKEYKIEASWEQKDYAKNWLDAGATLIIGSHPHVLQPWEQYTTGDGRETLIVYSLGNFVSNQSSLTKRTTIILLAGLTFNNGEVWVNGARYVPATMRNRKSPVELLVNDFSKAWDSEAEVLQFLAHQFGDEGRLAPGDSLVTNPRCY